MEQALLDAKWVIQKVLSPSTRIKFNSVITRAFFFTFDSTISQAMLQHPNDKST